MPGREFYGIAETAAIGHFVEICRIKSEGSKEQDHQQKAPQREFFQITNEQHDAEQHFENHQNNGDQQSKGHQKFQIQNFRCEVIFQFERKPNGIVQFYQPAENEQCTNGYSGKGN